MHKRPPVLMSRQSLGISPCRRSARSRALDSLQVYVGFHAEHLKRVVDKFWLVAAAFQLWNRRLARKVLVAFGGTQMDDSVLKEHAARCRSLADKADEFTKRRLLDLAARY